MLCHEWWLSQHFTHRCWAVCVTRERTWVAIHWLAATKSAKLPWFMWWYYPWRRFIPAVLRRWVVIKDNWPMLSFCFLIFRLCTIAHFNRNTICVLLLSFPLYLLHWTHFMVWWSCGLRDFWPFSSFVIQVWSQQEKSVLECLGADLGCLPTLCFRNMGFPFDCQKSDATLPSLNPFQSPLPICSSLMDEKKINMLGRFSCPNSYSGNPDLSKLAPLWCSPSNKLLTAVWRTQFILLIGWRDSLTRIHRSTTSGNTSCDDFSISPIAKRFELFDSYCNILFREQYIPSLLTVKVGKIPAFLNFT